MSYDYVPTDYQVFEEGDEASLFYVILEGSVGVYIRDQTAEEVAEEAKIAGKIVFFTTFWFQKPDNKIYGDSGVDVMNQEMETEILKRPEEYSWEYKKFRKLLKEPKDIYKN